MAATDSSPAIVSSAAIESEISTTCPKFCNGCGARLTFERKPKKANQKRSREAEEAHDSEDDSDDSGDSIDSYDSVYDSVEEEQLNPGLRQRCYDFTEQYKKSEGFDVPSPPLPSFLAIWPNKKLEDPELLLCARFAVDTQNKIEEEKGQGRKMEFIRIIKSMIQHSAGTMHYITLEVLDVNAGKPIICQAQVGRLYDKNNLYLFRDAPSV